MIPFEHGRQCFYDGHIVTDVNSFYGEDTPSYNEWIRGFMEADREIHVIKNYTQQQLEFEKYFVKTYIYPYYSQPHRHYHNVSHLEAIEKSVKNKKLNLTMAQKLAIWFHDIVYTPSSNKNEEDSVNLMKLILEQCKVRYHQLHDFNFFQAIDIASQIILDTKQHIPSSDESALVLDLDMEILAAGPQIYQKYMENIRLEYIVYDSETYSFGRKVFIEKTLEIERIFHTNLFHSVYNDLARINLQYEHSLLK